MGLQVRGINEIRDTLSKIEGKISEYKNQGHQNKTDIISSLPGVEQNILAIQQDIETIALKALKINEEEFINASTRLSLAIDGIHFLRGKEGKIVDYKQLSFFEKITSFFKQWFLGFTYVPVTNDPIDTIRSKQQVSASVCQMLLNSAPVCVKPEEGLIRKDMWGFDQEKSELWICQKDQNSPRSFSVEITGNGIRVEGELSRSWTEAFKKVAAQHNIPDSIESVRAIRESCEMELDRFIVRMDPLNGSLESFWYVKKDGNQFYFINKGKKIPFSITIDGFFTKDGKDLQTSFLKLFSVCEEQGLAFEYKKKREESLREIESRGIEGSYRNKQIILAEGSPIKLPPGNKKGSIIVIDRAHNNKMWISCSAGSSDVKEVPIKILENGEIVPSLKDFNLGCMQPFFVNDEIKKLNEYIKKENDISIKPLVSRKGSFPIGSGYRFVERKGGGLFGPFHKMMGSRSFQPEGYSIEVFGDVNAFFPLTVSPSGFSCTIDIFGSEPISDVSLSNFMQKVEKSFSRQCQEALKKDVPEEKFPSEYHSSLQYIDAFQKSLAEMELKYTESVQAIDPMCIFSKLELTEAEVEEQFAIARDLSKGTETEPIWNSADYVGGVWLSKTTKSYVFSYRRKEENAKVEHIDLNLRKEPGKITFELHGEMKVIPAEQFQEQITRLFPSIVFPNAWNKEYRKMEPFFEEIDKLKLDAGALESFVDDTEFLGEDAKGAVFADISKNGLVSLYIGGSKIVKQIPLSTCVHGDKLVIDNEEYNSIKEFLDQVTNGECKSLGDLGQLKKEKLQYLQSLIPESSLSVDKKIWKDTLNALKGEKCRLWEVVCECPPKRNLQIDDNGVLKIIPLDVVKREGGWKIRVEGLEFSSLEEVFIHYNLQSEDRYASAIKRKETVTTFEDELIGEQKRWMRTTKKHTYFMPLLADGEKGLFSRMTLLANEINRPLVVIYRSEGAYYRVVLRPHGLVQKDRIVVHTKSLHPYYCIESDNIKAETIHALVPKDAIDIVQAEQMRNRNARARKTVVHSLGYAHFYSIFKETESFFTVFSSFEEMKKAASSVVEHSLKDIVAGIFYDTEGDLLLLTRSKKGEEERFKVDLQVGTSPFEGQYVFITTKIPSGEVKTYDSFEAFCQITGAESYERAESRSWLLGGRDFFREAPTYVAMESQMKEVVKNYPMESEERLCCVSILPNGRCVFVADPEKQEVVRHELLQRDEVWCVVIDDKNVVPLRDFLSSQKAITFDEARSRKRRVIT